MTTLRPHEAARAASASLQASLDEARTGDLDDPIEAVMDGTAAEVTCTQEGCERKGVEYVFVPPTTPGVANVEARCAEHGDPKWRITDDGKAGWALRKVAAEARAEAEIDALYADELTVLNNWRDREKGKHTRTRNFFEAHLIAYGFRLRASDLPGKERSSHSLPAGTIKFTRSTRLEFTDEAATIAWCETNEHGDIVKKTVGKDDIKQLLGKPKQGGGLLECTPDGEKVPGIKIERPLIPKVTTT